MLSSFLVRGLSQVKPIYFGGKKVSIMMKRYLLLGRKAMANLDGILKSRDITLLTKVHIVKAMVFPVIMYGWES